MGMLFWVTGARNARVRSFFPESHGRPRVDDLRMLSGIVFIKRMGGMRRCAEGMRACQVAL